MKAKRKRGGGGRRCGGDGLGLGVGLLLLLAALPPVQSHGFLADPPMRSSMWRLYSRVPSNFNDNGLNCGGLSTQWGNNGGRCGVCGDAHGTTQLNMAPSGKYATGVIGRCYRAGTREITVRVQLTANHLGHFEFRLCPHNDVTTPVTQECLDRHVLQVRRRKGRYSSTLKVDAGTLKVQMRLLLPADVTCSQCVIQWKYVAGNNWGCNDGYKDCGIGKGPKQETFVNCADVAILPDCTGVEGHTPAELSKGGNSDKPSPAEQGWPSQTSKLRSSKIFNDVPFWGKRSRCVAVGNWAGNPRITAWCNLVCQLYCPSQMCRCP